MQQFMDDENVFTEEEEAVVDAVKESLQGKQEEQPSPSGPNQVFIIPLTRRPFFPGMAAPVVIEPGPFYEVLKIVAKTEHKCMGLFLTKTPMSIKSDLMISTKSACLPASYA